MSAAGGVSPLARALKPIWEQVPEDRWLAERELDELLLRAARAYEGDFARASALRAQLLTAQALEVRRIDGRRDVEYRRGPWTDWPAPLHGTEAFNDELRRHHEQNLRELDRQRQQELEDSPWGWQRKQLLELIDQRIDERLAELDAPLLARVRARLAAVKPDDAA